MLVDSGLGRVCGSVGTAPLTSLVGSNCAQADVVALWKLISTENNDNFVSFHSYAFNFLPH